MTDEQQHHTRNGLLAIFCHAKTIKWSHEQGSLTRKCADEILAQVKRIMDAHDRERITADVPMPE